MGDAPCPGQSQPLSKAGLGSILPLTTSILSGLATAFEFV